MLAGPLLATACSLGPYNKPEDEYLCLPRDRQLLVPPQLDQPNVQPRFFVPGLSAHQAGLLPQWQQARLQRHGASVWVEIDTTPEALWPLLESFWDAQGLKLARRNKLLGSIDSQWQSNGSLLRERIRIRLERMAEESEKSRLFVEQQREQKQAEDKWQPLPADAARKDEILLLLLHHLGLRQSEAQARLEAERR